MTIVNEKENILLIIDDEEDIRVLIKHIFEEQFVVLEAEDGLQGMAIAIQHLPNVVISDIMMPNLNGFEVCKQLKANEQTSHIPIVMLTAKADQISKLEGLKLGAIDYISKPFLIDELKTKLNNLIVQQNNFLKFIAAKYLNTVKQEQEIVENDLVSLEEKFLQKANAILNLNYSNVNFDIDFFAKELFLSTQQLRRKVKAVTNLTIIEFIRNFRFQKAEIMLKKNVASISEIAYAVGFDSVSYFSRVFQEHYQMSPSEYKSKF